MSTVRQANAVVNPVGSGGPGQPSKQTPDRLRAINRRIVQAALTGRELPADSDLARQLKVSERTVRTMRLQMLGLNRPELKRWQHLSPVSAPRRPPVERELVCATPFAGLWLLVPQLIDSGLTQAADKLRIVGRTRVQPIQIVLTLVAWAAVGFRRVFHVDDFRHWADMGLALFTGALHLWSDTTVWRWVHGLTPPSAAAFYTATASQVAGQPESQGRFSVDEHVVPSFTQLKPRRLGKTRVPSRGRASPAFRVYVPFDLDLGRFVGLLVRKAQESLSQTALSVLAELRRLRRRAGRAESDRVRLIVDRGAYKGSLFESLLADDHVSFIAMARATPANIRQWEVIPERLFRSYHAPGEDGNPPLKIARTQTRVTGCQYPIPSLVIRNETPDTPQRWRVLFYKNEPGHAPHAETIDAEYRRRQDHEAGFAQYVHALAGHSLPKAYQMFREPNAQGQKRTTMATAETALCQRSVQLVAWIKCLTFNLIKDFGVALGRAYAPLHVATLVRRYLVRPGRLYLHAGCLIVQLEPFRGDAALKPFIHQLNERRLPIPWLSNLIVQFEIATQPQGLAAVPNVLGQKILANSGRLAPL